MIYDLPIDPQDIQQILSFIDQKPFPCIFVEDDKMYINYHNQAVETVQKAISTPLPEFGDLKRGLTYPIYQVIPYDITVEQEQEILQQMPHCQYTRWHDLAIDIIPKKGGKQNGILEVLKSYHISLEETMAFGDGHNDIDMLKLVNIGVAMGNAKDEVKEAADEVTDDIDHDGIYQALKRHHII